MLARYYFDVFIEKYSIFRVHLLSNSVNLITFTGWDEKVGPQTYTTIIVCQTLTDL